MDIYDYAKYPSKDDWLKICGDKVETFNKLGIQNSKTKFNLLDIDEGYYGVNLSYWLKEFNNRAFDLIANYTLLKSYYDAGIPDDEWVEGQGTLLPYFEENHYGNLFWFSFYTDSYYTRFEGLIDAVYHLMNVKYKFDIEPSPRFRKKVLTKLETADEELYSYFVELPKNAVFKKVQNLRNDIVHNYRPNQFDSGYKRKENEDGSISFTMSIGEYTTSKEFLNNIHDSLDLLGEITDKIRDKVKLIEEESV